VPSRARDGRALDRRAAIGPILAGGVGDEVRTACRLTSVGAVGATGIRLCAWRASHSVHIAAPVCQALRSFCEAALRVKYGVVPNTLVVH
jgi:hypothetical protein